MLSKSEDSKYESSGMDGGDGAWSVMSGLSALTTSSIGLYALEGQPWSQLGSLRDFYQLVLLFGVTQRKSATSCLSSFFARFKQGAIFKFKCNLIIKELFNNDNRL